MSETTYHTEQGFAPGLTDIFSQGELLITDIANNGIDLQKQRQLIQYRGQLIAQIGRAKKEIKNLWIEQKNKELQDIKNLMEKENMKKTPAYEQVKDDNRGERYNIEKTEIDVEIIDSLCDNRSYHIRINELELNKLGV